MITFKTLEKQYQLNSRTETAASKGIVVSISRVELVWKFFGIKRYRLHEPKFYFKAKNDVFSITNGIKKSAGDYVMNWVEINRPFENFQKNIMNFKILSVIDTTSNLHSVLEFKSKLSN